MNSRAYSFKTYKEAFDVLRQMQTRADSEDAAYKRIDHNTYLCGECPGGEAWTVKQEQAPIRINLEYHNTPVVPWEHNTDNISLCGLDVKECTKRSTLERMGRFTPFQFWKRGEATFVQGPQGKPLPYPHASTLTPDGLLVDHCDDWLNEFDIARIYDQSDSVSKQLARALVPGKVRDGWGEMHVRADWLDHDVAMASPDIIAALDEYIQEGTFELSLVLALLDQSICVSQYRELIRACGRKVADPKMWKTFFQRSIREGILYAARLKTGET